MLKWIWCDVNGDGRYWRLVKEYYDELYFLEEDIIEKVENFLHYPQMGVTKPNVIPLARCAGCNLTTSALEGEVFYDEGQPYCSHCYKKEIDK